MIFYTLLSQFKYRYFTGNHGLKYHLILFLLYRAQSKMVAVDPTDGDGLDFDICLKTYLQQFIRLGNNITSLDEEHVYGCCNGTYSSNCSLTNGEIRKLLNEGQII